MAHAPSCVCRDTPGAAESPAGVPPASAAGVSDDRPRRPPCGLDVSSHFGRERPVFQSPQLPDTGASPRGTCRAALT
ncbi:MAG: hypothetical protein ACK53L_07205, partial [Pirellulaceae bacterium]